MVSTWDETLCVPREAANRDLVIAEMDQKRFTQYPILEAFMAGKQETTREIKRLNFMLWVHSTYNLGCQIKADFSVACHMWIWWDLWIWVVVLKAEGFPEFSWGPVSLSTSDNFCKHLCRYDLCHMPICQCRDLIRACVPGEGQSCCFAPFGGWKGAGCGTFDNNGSMNHGISLEQRSKCCLLIIISQWPGNQLGKTDWLIDWLIDALVWLPLFLPNFGHETVGFRYTFRYVNWYCRPGAMDSRTRHLTTPRMLDHPWPTRPITGKIITCWNDSGSWSWWPSCLHRKYLDLRRANQHGNQLFFFGPLAWPQSKYALHQCDWAW